MLIALLAILGVDLIVIVVLLAVVISRKRWVKRQPGAFPGAIRLASGELDGFGAKLLGYDAHSGEDLRFPDGILRMAPDWYDLTKDPRKYGFHATLKAPFSLAPGKAEAELLAACKAFASTPRTIPVIRPVVGWIGGFIAVIPAEPSAGLIRLAADCVSEFDPLRAPLTSEDRARRSPSELTPRQREHLALGISLRHGRLPLPPDADGPTSRGAT